MTPAVTLNSQNRLLDSNKKTKSKNINKIDQFMSNLMGFTPDEDEPLKSNHPADNEEFDTPLGMDYNSLVPGE